jgi:MFS family permease
MDDNKSIGELAGQAAGQVSTLVRDEIKLAQAELGEKARGMGTGAGLYAAAGVLAGYGVGAGLLAAGFGLALVMPGWAAALVVMAVLFVVAVALALLARARLRQTSPVVPEQAIANIKNDVDTVTVAIRDRR